MTLKIKYVVVSLGKNTIRHTMADPYIKDIGIDADTMALIVVKESGEMHTYFGCPYELVQEEVPEIIMPDDKITDSVVVS